MINTICVAIIYCLELLNLQIICKHMLGLKIKFSLIKTIISAASVLGIIILDIIAEQYLYFRQFTFFSFIIALILTGFEIKSKKQILKLISASLILKVISMLLWLCGVSIGVIRYDNFKYTLAFLVINLLIMLSVIAVVHWSKRHRNSILFADYSRSELLYFISGETALILTLSIITEYSSHFSNITPIGIPVIIISTGVMIFICYSLLSLKYQNSYMKIEHDTTVKMLYSQEQYYKMLLEKEEQTKSFKHDIRNHLYSMKVLCDSSEYTQLRDYIDKLIETKVDFNKSIYSGDKLADVILNTLINRFPSVKLRIFGAFNEKHEVDYIDICTILSNLLTNAFEAAVQSDDKFVRLHIKRLNGNLVIKIQNSIRDVPIIINNDIKTSKSGLYHGFGLNNVKMSLARYNGFLELNCNEKTFEASVIIPGVLEINDR